MWLINNETFELEDFLTDTKPPYAILSHTWGARETGFSKLIGSPDVAKTDPKICNTCRIAKEHGLRYVWIDTCCIDKSSSAELGEAIRSMYRWYRDATICFVYLNDVSPSIPVADGIRDCRWRKRGWTLQELIAPTDIQFFDAEWQLRGNKTTLLQPLAAHTRIPAELLAGDQKLEFYESLSKMAWASERRTSRTEDLAYCLMGIFDVNMPLLYGEGQKAFQRLQEEILKKTPDISLLLWQGWTHDGVELQKAVLAQPFTEQQSTLLPVLAESPNDFLPAESSLAIAVDQAVEMSLHQLSLTIYNDATKIVIQELGRATFSHPMRYWFDVRGVMGGRQAKIWLPLRKIAPGTFAIESRESFMSEGAGLKSASVMSKLSLVLRPDIHTRSRASKVREWGIRIPTTLLPSYYVSGVRPQMHWDPTDRIFFREFQGSANTAVYSIELQSPHDKQKLMILFEPLWRHGTPCRIARVSNSDEYMPKVECSPSLHGEVWDTFVDSGISWHSLVTRWPEVLDWRNTSYMKTGKKELQRQKFSAQLCPNEMVSFGNTIMIFDLILKME